MLLQKLGEYSGRIELAPPMYQRTAIRWLIELDKKGKYLGFVSTVGEGGKKDRGKTFFAPHIGRSSGVRAKLLADNGEYVLGVPREKAKRKRVRECHRAFVKEVKACADSTAEASVLAVLSFLEQMHPDTLKLPEKFSPADTLTFRVEGVLPIDLDCVRRYWAAAAGSSETSTIVKAKAVTGLMECLVCGQLRPPVKRLPFKIKRIPGGQTSGMALISANVAAFESYGLEASLIAPTCQECGERFSKAANTLIQGEDTHITIGPLVYVFWTKDECGFSPASILSNPEPTEVQALIKSAFSGKSAATAMDATPFYATAFSASGGRVAVRDWLETTVENAKQNLARYFKLQQIVERDGSEGRPYGLYPLVASTVRDANKDLSPNVPQILLHVALKGGRLPMSLLYQAVKRNRAARSVTRPRAVLIKMVLLSQEQEELNQEGSMTQLDASNQNPAYLCGRLLAVLESLQYAALGELGATVTDRFYGTASSAPASVFGVLLRGARAHLEKLRKEKRGTYIALDARLRELAQQLTSFPKALTWEEQGLFSLGYYHQRAEDFRSAKERSQQGTQTDNESDEQAERD